VAESESTTEMVNARLERALVERARNAIWHVGRGHTLSCLMRDGLLAEVIRLEEEHHAGKPFPQREGELPKSSKGKGKTQDQRKGRKKG
jgi:hypothetical protein